MILVLPCGGESSRFPGLRPKWLLTQPNGNLMVCDAIKLLNLSHIDKIVLIAMRKHLVGNEDQLRQAFLDSGCQIPVSFHILDQQTSSQPETIASFLSTLEEDVPIFVKDCDGQFFCMPEPKNEVITADISNLIGSETTSKSYCKSNDRLQITAIVEKQVISRDFCVGGYSFASSRSFLRSYEQLRNFENLYVSHVIEHMMLHENIVFTSKSCNQYEDWGTNKSWQRYKKTFATIFLDIDGVIFKNASQYFHPMWGEGEPLQKNIDFIKRLKETQRVQLILTTSRSSNFAEITERQMKNFGIKYDNILYNMQHSQRIIVNDYSKSNPYKSCDAVNVKRDSEDLEDFLSFIIS